MSDWYFEEFSYCIILILYPGPVSLSVEISNTKMSLREAARKHSVMKNDIIKCKCKCGCKTTHFFCKRNNKKSLSHCHKSLKCSNGDECDVYENFKNGVINTQVIRMFSSPIHVQVTIDLL